jgi:hypothetical protein
MVRNQELNSGVYDLYRNIHEGRQINEFLLLI